MDYLFQPPEINSFRMYAGPGASSLLAAAGTWDAVSAELGTTAEGYDSVVSGLDLQWRGPASQMMTVAATEYIGWLQRTAELTRQTAMQLRAVAAAYEQARATTIPPMAVTSNRTRQAALVATNILGQNTAAISQLDLQYAQYWAQDATAMSSYDTSSRAATTQLQKFSSPNKSTNESGLTAQNASVAASKAAGSSSASQAISGLTHGTNAAPLASSSSTVPTNPIIPDDFTALDALLFAYSSINGTYNIEAFTSGIIGAENNLGILPDLGAAAAAPAELPALAGAPQLVGAASSLGGGAGLGNISAALSNAGRIGPMSVPATWSAPSTTHISALEPAGFTTLPGTDEPVASGYPGYPGMPGVAGRGMGVGAAPKYGVRLTVIPRPPAAG
jgi:PPE-repeat protein